MADYSEILMQSMDILVNKRLSELQFDKTISCQITDTTAADKGEYIVSDGSNAFTAYSKDVTFKKGDSVYVTIPNGDFNNQKQIIGKYVGPDESLNYLSPLDAYVDITGDLCNFTAEASLLANREDIKKEKELTEFHSKKTIWKAEIQNGKGFERLGIKADFKTWLKKLNVNNGNYGLCLYVKYVDKGNVNGADSEKVAHFILDSDDMYGNPYNFNSFFTQEKVFDISHIKGQITYMELVFYQDFNFTDVNGVAVPTKDNNGDWLIDNIYVNNIHIGMGYDIEKFKEDTVLVYCLNEPTYNYNNLTQENRKTLQLRWVRVTNEGIYTIDTEKEIPENSAIHWYRYEIKIQEEVDELAGPMWFEIEEGLNKLQLDVDPNPNEISQLYKVVVEIPSKQWIEQKLDADYNSEYANIKYLATEGTTEEIRQTAAEQLASYENDIQSQRRIYESETIEFKSEVPVVDRMTADLINGLKIEVDEKGYKGNYMLYNASNKITNINEATKMRVMRATYKSLVTGEETLDGAESIIWKIPLISTMIYPPEDGKEYKSGDGATSYWVESGFAYIKRMSGNSNSGTMGTINDWSCEQKFRIKDYYQESATNNTVYCYVVKNNIAYEASVELYFGPMSSNGTDFTFKMGFESDTAAVTRETPEVLRVNFQMFDFNNDKVPNFWKNGITVDWYSKNGIDEIYFCNQDGKIVSNSEFTFLDASGKTISDNKTIPTKVIVKANHFYIKYLGTAGVVPNYYVAQAVVTTDPTIGAGAAQANHVRLSCQLLIPYRDNKKYAGIEGATHILYNSSGTSPEFYDGKYRLWRNEENDRVEETGITWRVYPIFSTLYQPYFPKMGEGTKLIIPSTYVEGLSTQICVQAIGQNEKVLWSHPIVMMKDAYSSAMLNAWDGNLTIDNENGTILSTMIGAGKKENDNSYSGVLMGDVKCALDDITKIGLYGFNFGLQSFGWMVDGTGFIGKNGQGQIRFDGNNGTISSGVWKTSGGKIGMEIDLDGPTTKNKVSTGSTFNMKGLAGSISFDTSAKSGSTNLFVVQGRVADGVDSDGNPIYEAVTISTDDTNKTTTLSKALNYKDMIKISVGNLESDGANGKDAKPQKSSFYMQSLNFDASAKTGTRLDLQNGKFISYGTHGRLEIATSTTTFFRLADLNNKPLFLIKSTVGDTDDANGTDAVAQVSQYYLQSSNFDSSDKTGTRLDLQKGKYTSYGNYGRIEMAPDSTTFFRLADRTNKVLFVIKGSGDTDGETTSQYYLQSSNFDGSSLTGTRLDLQNGKFTTYGSSGYVIVDSGNDAIFRVYAKSDDNYHGLMYVGNKSTYYIQNLDWATSGGIKGSKWNLKDGSFNAYGDGGKISIQPNSKEHLFEVQDNAGTTLINIGNGTYGSSNSYYYLQSSGYQLSTKDTKGQGFRIDIGNGTISASDFNLFAKGASGYIQIGTSGTYAIDVNNKFQVEWDGDTYLRKSAILTVEEGAIQSGGNDSIAAGKHYKFNKDGAVIGGWTVTEKEIKSNNISLKAATGTLSGDSSRITADNITIKWGTGYFYTGYSEDLRVTLSHPMASGLNVGTGGVKFFKTDNSLNNGISFGYYTPTGSTTGWLRCGGPFVANGDIKSDNGNICITAGHAFKVLDSSGNSIGNGIGQSFMNSIKNSAPDGTYGIEFDPGWGVGTVKMSITVENGLITAISGSGLTTKPADS